MLPLHPITNDYHDFTGEEIIAMREDLRKHGLQLSILIWNGQIVDGRHRAKLCEELNIEPFYSDISDRTEEQMRAMVQSLNQHRRANTKPLTNAEKKARIEGALKKDPARSNVAIAEECGVHHDTVREHRKKMEDQGVAESATPAARKSKSGKKGEGQHKKPKADRPPAPAKKKPTNIVSALNSLAWTDATAAQRIKFISDVSVKSIWKAMTNEQRDQLIDIIDEQIEAQEAAEKARELARMRS